MHDHVRGSRRDLVEPVEIAGLRIGMAQVREVSGDGEVEELPQQFDIAPCGKDFEVAEARERRRHPAHHGARLGGGMAVIENVAHDLFTGQGER